MSDNLQIRFKDEQKLARHILGLCHNRPRTLVGVAGIPGSGKSTLARHLRDALDHISQHPGTATMVPLDGFHFTNAELEQRGLSEHKGSPETFHVPSFFAKLIEIKRASAPVLMPIYSREIHEPIPDALEVTPETSIVVVEGNYLFCDLGKWRSIATLCDIRIFVDAKMKDAAERVITRHVLGGLTPEEAAAKYERNDKPNSELIWPSRKNAEILFEID